MATIDVTPANLREAGQTLFETRENELAGSADLLHGYGDPDGQFISIEGFPMGTRCQARLTELYLQACNVYQLAYFDLLGLSSALHIAADLFDVSDVDNAFLFAFLHVDANVPKKSDLPWHLRDWEENNSRALHEQMEFEAALAGDGAMPSKYRTETYPLGSVTEVTEVWLGNVLVAKVTVMTPPGGPRITTVRYYDEDGTETRRDERYEKAGGEWTEVNYEGDEVVLRRDHTLDENGGARTVTLQQQEDGQLHVVREDVKEVDDDGSITYKQVNADGETTSNWAIGPQPTARTHQEVYQAYGGVVRDQNQQIQEMVDNEAYQYYLRQGATPDENGMISWEEAERMHFQVTGPGLIRGEVDHYIPLAPLDDPFRDQDYPDLPRPTPRQ